MSSFTFELKTDEKGLEATVQVFGPGGGELLSAENLIHALRRTGIVYGIDRHAIKELLNEPHKQRSVVIARGVEAIEGVKGEYSFAVKMRPTHVNSDNDSINYRDSLDLPIVKRGGMVCTYTIPVAGVSGKSIFGKIVEVENGDPLPFTFGKNIDTSTEGEARSLVEGMVSINSKGELDVSPVYIVEGDVDMTEGNINYQHSVLIKGSVKTGFSIQAGGDVVINGSVDDSSITSHGNVTIGKGVNGKGKGKITAKGDVSAMYLNQVEVEAFGSVDVIAEVNRSTVKTNGWLRIPHGSILAGEIHALRGIIANDIGSELGVSTRIFVGTNYRIRELKALLLKLSKDMRDLDREVSIYVHDTDRFKNATFAEQEELAGSYEVFKAKVREWKRSKEELEKLEDEFEKVSPRIEINGTLREETTIRSAHCGKLFGEDIKGPLVLIEDIANNTIRPEK